MNESKNIKSDIVLRDVIDEDLNTFFDHLSDAEANYMAAFTAKDPTDRVAFNEKWTKIRSSTETIIKTILVNERVVGHIAKFLMLGKPEISYWIGKEFWGKGIATRACMMLLNEIEDRPLYARAAKDNIVSIRVLEKCGFVKTGVEKAFANARGKEIDEVIFRLT
jgi:RimJ/RimL family protein N-acetyltransferase